ncbi:MAG: hypothetical protein DCC53_05315 [Chloroflexi bacterium]|nr:hypothetical protein [Anaerolineae bacterium]RIK21867.1 MAG: hypothetical protein DCC53_05315 [Chloroflexota bacterium]GIK28829.1 MAG: hypothetical protein BroJett007_19670 [Chloroflexota bacterium]
MNVHHFALTFSPAEAAQARERRSTPERVGAWGAFESLCAQTMPDPLQQAVVDALSWRLTGDGAAAERAAAVLAGDAIQSDEPTTPLIDACRRAIGFAQALECVRDHGAMPDAARAAIIDRWHGRVSALNSRLAQSAIHEQAWIAAVNLAAGVVLERESMFDAGADSYRRIVDSVQPHGYIAAIVEPRDADALTRTLAAVHGLVLAAEIAAQADIDLWAYERRGVSVMTAALYPLYYYFYPEKWPWFEGLELGPVQVEFRQYAAFLELVNHKNGGSVRAVKLILDDVRPVFDALGGGPVTLTHAVEPVARRGLFRR